ncbi:hypothetical protein E2320_014400, partial [Naja naja]
MDLLHLPRVEKGRQRLSWAAVHLTLWREPWITWTPRPHTGGAPVQHQGRGAMPVGPALPSEVASWCSRPGTAAEEWETKGCCLTHSLPECNKSFSGKTTLAIHQRIHSGGKPQKCSECEECFNPPPPASAFRRHIRNHTGEQPYKGADTRQQPRKSMKRGKLSDPPSDTSSLPRTPKRTHECSECGKSFACRSLLLTHRKVHVGSGSSQGLE